MILCFLPLYFTLISNTSAFVYRPFLGLDAGYSRIESDMPTEASKNGFHLIPKGLVNFRWNPISVDLGLGWIFNRSSGSDGTIVEDTVTTYGAEAELGARYRFSDRWELGVLSQSAFGSNFNFGSEQKESHFSVFAGPQLIYEIMNDLFPLRLSGQFLTDLNIESRQVYLATLGILVGFNWRNLKDSAQVSVSSEPEAILTTVELSETYFELNKSNIKIETRPQLVALAQVLKNNSSEWERIRIEGHTDSRGSRAFNQKLSHGRAQAVADVFEQTGIPTDRISVRGFGFDKPKAEGQNEQAWQQNRRVEVRLEGTLSSEFLEKLKSWLR